MLARLGEQSGVVANALRKFAPSRASRSMCGVRENGWPVQPRSSQRRSSTRMKMMLGFEDLSAAQLNELRAQIRLTRMNSRKRARDRLTCDRLHAPRSTLPATK